MLGNALLTFYRVTIRHPLYAALTLFGLGFGIAVFVVIALFVRYETSFEDWLPGVERVYQVQRNFMGWGSGAQEIGYETQGGCSTICARTIPNWPAPASGTGTSRCIATGGPAASKRNWSIAISSASSISA